MKYLLYIIFVWIQIVSIRGYSQINKAHVWGAASGFLNPDLKVVDVFAGAGWTAVLQEDGSYVTWGVGVTVPHELQGGLQAFADGFVVNNVGTLIQLDDAGIPYKITNHTQITKVDGSDYYTIVLDYLGNVELLIEEGQQHPNFDGSYASNLRGIKDVSVGYNHALAISSAGKVIAWGIDEEGETIVPAISESVTQVSAGDYFSVALTKSGQVKVWGADRDSLNNVPAELTKATMISAGSDFILALNEDGEVFAWGGNGYGQTDVPDTLSEVIKIAAGSNHAVALTENGDVVTWGFNYNLAVRKSEPLYDIRKIVTGQGYSTGALALHLDGSLSELGGLRELPADFTGFRDIGITNKCIYGINENLQVEQDCGREESIDLDLSLETGVVEIETSANHLLLLKKDGTVAIYGDSTDMFGNEKEGGLWMPSNLSGVIDVACGYGYSMALKNDGTVVVWGGNTENWGKIDTLSNVNKLVGGGIFAYTVSNNGRVNAWGGDVSSWFYKDEVLTVIRDSIVELRNVKSLSRYNESVVALVGEDSIVVQGKYSGYVEMVPPNLTGISAVFATRNLYYAIEGEIPPLPTLIVGVDETRFISSSLLFPNPSTNTVRVDGYEEGVLSLKNTMGNEVLRTVISQESISVEELLSGFYLYEIIQGREVVKQGKFIKQ